MGVFKYATMVSDIINDHRIHRIGITLAYECQTALQFQGRKDLSLSLSLSSTSSSPCNIFLIVVRFSAEALNWLFMRGLIGWFVQVLLLKMTLLSLGSGEVPLLDLVAYSGYTFTGVCLAVLGRILWHHSYYVLMPFTCLCMGIFLVKTMKRVLFAEVRSHDSSKRHFRLLFIAFAQFPLYIWLGNIGVNWFFQTVYSRKQLLIGPKHCQAIVVFWLTIVV